jgi:hypothetical protein
MLRETFTLDMACNLCRPPERYVNIGSCRRERAPSPSVKPASHSRDGKSVLNRPQEATFAVATGNGAVPGSCRVSQQHGLPGWENRATERRSRWHV